MPKKYDLMEYRFATTVVKDFPTIVKIIERFRRELKPYNKYVSVQNIINSIDESSDSIFSNMNYYKDVVNNKGAKDE